MKTKKEYASGIKNNISQKGIESVDYENETLELLKYVGKLSESILDKNIKQQKNFIAEIFTCLVILSVLKDKEICYTEDEYDVEEARFVGGTYQEYLSEILEYFYYEFNIVSIETLDNLIFKLFKLDHDLDSILNEKYN